MQVRRARQEDLPHLVRHSIAVACETEGWEPDAEVVGRAVQAALVDEAKALYFVAGDDAVVASLFVTREWSDWRGGWYWWIQGVYVEPSQRRRGILGQLVQRVRQEAIQRGDVYRIRLYVERDNRSAQRAYEAIGFGREDYLVFDLALETASA